MSPRYYSRWLGFVTALEAEGMVQMGARAVVVVHVQEQHVTQMAFAEYHDMINAFPADRSDQPFSIRILPG